MPLPLSPIPRAFHWRNAPVANLKALWRTLPFIIALAFTGSFFCATYQYFDRISGFSRLAMFGATFHENMLPSLKKTAAYVYEGTDSIGYDGQFYAQIAVDPTLQDPALERAVDNLPYRARRILFPALAYWGGFGKPLWVVNVYSTLNLISWCWMGILLTHWLPLTDFFNLFRWLGCMFCAGLMTSCRLSLTDGPSMCLLLVTLRWYEQRRDLPASLLLGIACLGRETNILAASLQPLPTRERRRWFQLGLRTMLIAGPLGLWLVFLKLRFPHAPMTGTHNFSLPGTGLLWKVRELAATWSPSNTRYGILCAITLLSLVSQMVYLCLRPAPTARIWRLGLAYGLLGLVLGTAVWEGYTTAAARALLPLTFAFNLQLSKDRTGWLFVLLGNLSILQGWEVYHIPGLGLIF